MRSRPRFPNRDLLTGRLDMHEVAHLPISTPHQPRRPDAMPETLPHDGRRFPQYHAIRADWNAIGGKPETVTMRHGIERYPLARTRTPRREKPLLTRHRAIPLQQLEAQHSGTHGGTLPPRLPQDTPQRRRERREQMKRRIIRDFFMHSRKLLSEADRNARQPRRDNVAMTCLRFAVAHQNLIL